MKRIVLKGGKTYRAQWCAVSSLDDSLRLSVSDTDMNEAFADFSNSEEVESISYYMNDNDSDIHSTFEGYTNLQGIVTQGKAMIITLARGD